MFPRELVEKVGTRAKKKEWQGRGRGRKEKLASKPHDFEKPPTNAASDWCGAGSVDYLALETSIKPGMLCLRASHLVLSDLWWQITNALDWYSFESCLCKGLRDQSLQSIIGDRVVETREGQFIVNDGVRIWSWLEKMDCYFVGDNTNVKQNIGNRLAKAAMDKRFISFLKWKGLFIYWKFIGMYCRERFKTGWRAAAQIIFFDQVSDETKPHN